MAAKRPEHITCITRHTLDRESWRGHTSWCGRTLWSYEFAFVNIDHAAENGAQQGRLVACPECAAAVQAALLNWQPMKTAPTDGREVVLAVEYRAGVPRGVLVGHHMEGGHCIEDHPAIDKGWYFWNGAMFDKASNPIGWLPLPPHPQWTSTDWQGRKQGLVE